MRHVGCRPATALIIAVLLAAAAACSSSEPAEVAAGDGVLDCPSGQVARSVDMVVNADTQENAVADALAEWADAGAVLVPLPPDESWAAQIGDRDVALAYPERDGDGTWTVHDVRTCGEPDAGAAPIDGELDCATDEGWSQQAGIAADAIGSETARKALTAALAPHQDRHGGDIEFFGEAGASLVVDSREQVVAIASPLGNGTWVVATLSGCAGFD